MKTVPVKHIFFIFSCLLSSNCLAEEEQTIPDLEFLEFLGSFATDDGKWIDPMEIEKVSLTNEHLSDSNSNTEEQDNE